VCSSKKITITSTNKKTQKKYKKHPGRQNGAVGMCVITFLELGISEVEKKREMKIAGY
jgi:hypothetical protein